MTSPQFTITIMSQKRRGTFWCFQCLRQKIWGQRYPQPQYLAYLYIGSSRPSIQAYQSILTLQDIPYSFLALPSKWLARLLLLQQCKGFCPDYPRLATLRVEIHQAITAKEGRRKTRKAKANRTGTSIGKLRTKRHQLQLHSWQTLYSTQPQTIPIELGHVIW